MSVINNLRLRQSVGIVVTDNNVEFFRSNTRSSLSLKMNYEGIIELLQNFDGNTSIEKIIQKNNGISLDQLNTLARFLHNEYILIEENIEYPINLIKTNYRIINILEDYCHSTAEVLEAIKDLKKSRVMIVGLGAVGSLVATYLAKSNVGNLILVDSDTVDISNLHRQYYFESEVFKKKAEQLCEQIKAIDNNVNIEIIDESLTSTFFKEKDFLQNINLIINCADEPNVDTTSRIIAEYAMKHKIPHIVGGGYNLHLTLIGQTIIPFQTACFNCFTEELNIKNNDELKNIKKLNRTNRKLGSFSPLSGIAASLASLDAFKLLIGKYEFLQQVNKRIEFNISQSGFNVINIPKKPDCKWCGS